MSAQELWGRVSLVSLRRGCERSLYRVAGPVAFLLLTMVGKDEKLRAIRELMSVKEDLRAAQMHSGPVLPPRVSRTGQPAHKRVTLEEMLGSPAGVADAAPASPGRAPVPDAELLLNMQRALREARASEQAAHAAVAAAQAQVEAQEAALAAQNRRIADLTQALESGGGSSARGTPGTPGMFREVLALRDQIVELQSALECERAARAQAESQLRLARSSVTLPAFAAPRGSTGLSSILAAASDPAWCASYADLPPGGHWAMGPGGSIWYLTPAQGSWKQNHDGSFILCQDVPANLA